MKIRKLIIAPAVSLLTLATASAYAQEEAAAPAPEPAEAAAPAEATGEAAGEGSAAPLKHFTLTANPLSIVLGRYSINFEYMLARHHGLIAVPSAWFMSAESGDTKWSFRYLGGELGYHFYSGDRGANGFFVGPSLIYMNLNTSVTGGSDADSSASSSTYGVAVDVGGQHVARNGFTIGGGFGVAYIKTSSSASSGDAKPTVTVSGTMPRFLFTIGYSF